MIPVAEPEGFNFEKLKKLVGQSMNCVQLQNTLFKISVGGVTVHIKVQLG